MKNQYFGDARDYFKYELLDVMMSDLPDLRQLTCVWMLTEDDQTSQGKVPISKTSHATELGRFLAGCVEQGRRDVRAIETFFGGRPYAFRSYGDGPPHFSERSRTGYFASLPDDHLHRSLVFFDPDIGMEPTVRREAHLSFEELVTVLERMGSRSVGVVFQFARRQANFWPSLAASLASRTDRHVACIHDGHVGFFILATDGSIAGAEAALQRLLTRPESRGRRTLERIVRPSHAT